ncbi:UvrD-helicase domain-containing protein [Actinomyces sp. zg328]|uniref:UvrD-helicase domain-containing protein n=1 Tax=Actinomyces sp. zg328 TaxID=2609287 RepID=UPI00135AF6D2|nr:UvrD-helicase domain-containing protein [Actinomyces sp. zg328]
MVQLTNAQALAAAATDRLVNVISAPGSGKTTIAAERYGYLRYQPGDLRGVVGLTFNRAAAAELRHRIELRWGSKCITTPHHVVTFDQLHVDLLTFLLREERITWPNKTTKLDVCDDYRAYTGFRFLTDGDCKRFACLDNNNCVVSRRRKVTKPEAGISKFADHQTILDAGTVSHEDVRSILHSAMQVDELKEVTVNWLSENYRALVVDEVYDGNTLDLHIVYLAAEGGLSITLVGDPWQALYRWRGAEPEAVKRLLHNTSDPFIEYEQPESFRYTGDQMPQLAATLRARIGITLPDIDSSEVDVALARNWTQLWTAGNNVLPLAFRTVNNATDAAMNLFLDVATRTRLGTTSYGREAAITKLGLDRENFQKEQDELFAPLVASLIAAKDEAEVLEDLLEAVKSLGVRKPRRPDKRKESDFRMQLSRLAERLRLPSLIPGLTVFQAKGREWERVGVVLSQDQVDALKSGLDEHEEEDCITYVAITRARRFCGLLSGTTDLSTLDI